MRTKLGSSSTSMNANESAISQGSKCGLSNTCCVKIMLNTLNKAGTPLDELQLLYCTQLAIKTNQLTLDSQKELFRSIQLSKKEPDQTYPSFLYALSISVREQYSLNGFRYWLRPCFLFHVTLELKSIFLLLH
ncbi:hypothetical protein [Legionella parisiensis]|nr:hypothetical protein [Legionella parisiensis]